ncbi:phytanoyl-CoA dioxygenase family protein [Dyella silvatica]|uniref:phytanoyl-CoA dioxygenase family protein n=1 Tax=Dyella silvatica TaxID=2992128 RepID=UPI00225BD3A5|nr:phytanoyl-CoA dioxygenase family protein [Dyella silvatica]
MSTDSTCLDIRGFALLPSLMTDAECDLLTQQVDALQPSSAGSRRLLALEPFAGAATTIQRHPDLKGLLGDAFVAVQCNVFCKSPAANWLVAPHQDLSIPVLQRQLVAGWSGWSQKEGVLFVQPPCSILESLLIVRLQLDTDAEHTGPLEVVPGSHRLGRLSAAQIREHAAKGRYRCVVPRGGAVALRPLLIHSSSKAVIPGHRRVLHFVFGPAALPSGLQWAEAV